MSIKTWQERIDANYPNPTRGPELVQHYMQAEIDEIRSELVRRDAEIDRLKETVRVYDKRIVSLGCLAMETGSHKTTRNCGEHLKAEITAQRKELEQLTETSVWQAGRISELLDEVAAQRKALEMALVALEECSIYAYSGGDGVTASQHREAITAIQEQLK